MVHYWGTFNSQKYKCKLSLPFVLTSKQSLVYICYNYTAFIRSGIVQFITSGADVSTTK